MSQDIVSMMFPMRIAGFSFGTINCYLIKTDTGFVLIDTGFPKNRHDLETGLEKAGCRPGNLRLIVLTHGDLDHAGNGAYLKEKYGAKVAMHRDESGVVELGDNALNRRKSLFNKIRITLLSVLMSAGKLETFHPDLLICEGDDLSEYGLKARVLYLPGHSKGSIGILTDDGDLFCGDLVEDISTPDTSPIVDDRAALKESMEKLRPLPIKTVYPGHGKPFPMDAFPFAR